MRLYELLKEIKIKCSNIDLNHEALGIASDSRKIKKGYVFVAISGSTRDGNDYINEAFQNGAIAVVTEKRSDVTMLLPTVIVKNARKALSIMWNAYYQNPTKDLKIIAITGTNGKTSTAYTLYSILKEAYGSCGLISTIECLIDDEIIDLEGGAEVSDISSAMTTPDPEKLYKLFYNMKNRGIKYVVMEASSHALFLDKLYSVNIHIGAFTNLSKEHLDFHKTVNDYFNSKAKLFDMCKIGVINYDDDYGKILKNRRPRLRTASTKGKSDFYIERVENIDTGLKIFANLMGEKIELETKLLGKFVPQNILLSIAISKLLGIENKYIIEGVKKCTIIKGRMEKVTENIFIDYAHTPKAMENAILSIKEAFKNKKIMVLFGCGGNRDKSKRSIMGNIAYDLADELIITSDNSRDEEPEQIINDILKGIKGNKTYFVVPNRKEAICLALKRLSNSDVLLLLGKGHEKYEIDKNGKHYFDEREIIYSTLK